MLQSTASQGVGYDQATAQQQQQYYILQSGRGKIQEIKKLLPFIHLNSIPKPDLSLMIQSCSKKLSKAIKRSVESKAFGWRRSNTNI